MASVSRFCKYQSTRRTWPRNDQIRPAPLQIFAQRGTQTGAQTSERPGLNWALGIEAAWDDNLLRAAEDMDSDFYYALQPTLAWLRYSVAHQFDVAASGNFRRYMDEGVLDYDA